MKNVHCHWLFLLPHPCYYLLAIFLMKKRKAVTGTKGLIFICVCVYRASLVAQMVNNPLSMQETQETWVQSLGWEDPLEEDVATHSSIPAWEIS